jgi:hypothetical protein
MNTAEPAAIDPALLVRAQAPQVGDTFTSTSGYRFTVTEVTAAAVTGQFTEANGLPVRTPDTHTSEDYRRCACMTIEHGATFTPAP